MVLADQVRVLSVAVQIFTEHLRIEAGQGQVEVKGVALVVVASVDKMKNVIKLYKDRLRLYKKYGYDILRTRDFILDKTKIIQGSVLEIGTGKGHMAIALARRGLRFTSIDLDRKSQNIAKVNLKAMKLEKFATFRIMDAEKLKYRDGAFDYVVAVNFIYHSKNPVKCLKEMFRVTKNKLIIADLNKKGSHILDEIHKLDGHKHEISKISINGIKKILQKYGPLFTTYKNSCQVVLVAEKG